MKEFTFIIGKEDSALLDKLEELKAEGINRYIVTNREKNTYTIRTK